MPQLNLKLANSRQRWPRRQRVQPVAHPAYRIDTHPKPGLGYRGVYSGGALPEILLEQHHTVPASIRAAQHCAGCSTYQNSILC
jgi:hypothetical protein